MNIIRSVFTRKYVSEKNAKNKLGAGGEKKNTKPWENVKDKGKIFG